MLGPIFIVVLLLMVIGALPTWRHSREWGYFPGGLIGLGLIVVIFLALTGRL